MSEIILQQPMKSVPPRIARNRSELEKLLAAKGEKSIWPSLEKQLPAVAVKGLPVGAYNPCIIRFRGRLVMTYRFHPTEAYSTKLAICELDEHFNVAYNQELELEEETSQEDARLFIWKADLWISFTVSTFPQFPSSQVKIAKLYKPDRWRVSDKNQYWLPDRQTAEKNHVPLVEDEELHIIYRHNQIEDGDPTKLTQVIYSPEAKREMKTPALRWPYGDIRGGTVPIPYNSKLLKFFHSSTRNDQPPTTWRYRVGAMLMKAERPHQMLAVSKRPILIGSESGGDESRFHFKKNIVFPAGVIEHDGGWTLSVGQNDSACLLVKITEKDLNL